MVAGTAWYRDRTGFDVDAHNARQAEEIPVGRVATAEDVADTVCFLLSDEGGYLTGVNIPVDGGRGERMP
jgi:NAD(P)-dependent dehydrogenase (short-subunit alcohol dehydrogenase family)